MQLINARTRISPQVVDEASAWFVEFRLGEADADTRKRFDTWLRASPAHIRAYIEIAATYAELESARPHIEMNVDELIDAARADTTVVPMRPSRAMPEAERPPRSRRLAGLAAAATVLLILGGIWLLRVASETYATRIGEQRSLTLEDGSRIELNARSRIRIHFGETERRVELSEGQALFHVAKDPSRPFVVRTDDISIRAVGTQFDVNREHSGTTVTVIEGRVAVAPQATAVVVPTSPGESSPTVASASEVLLGAGQQLILAEAQPLQPRQANLAAATAWTQRQLIFDATPLADAVEQFNRHNRRQLVVTSAELGKLSISGVYDSPDPQSLLNFLRSEPDIVVVEGPDEVRISKKH
jgi:transmembrane sensor